MRAQLKSGQCIDISPEDADILDSRNWRISSGGYVRSDTSRPQRRSLHLHRLILERVLGRSLTDAEEVDHINRVPSDNRRENLRLATRGEQMANRRYRNKSGFRGVYLPQQKYTAAINFGTGKIQIGSFDTPEEAAWMFDQYALAVYGDFATLNFEYV